MAKFCSNCGKEVTEEQEFCLNCGVMINKPKASSNQPKKEMNVALFIILLILFLPAGIIYYLVTNEKI